MSNLKLFVNGVEVKGFEAGDGEISIPYEPTRDQKRLVALAALGRRQAITVMPRIGDVIYHRPPAKLGGLWQHVSWVVLAEDTVFYLADGFIGHRVAWGITWSFQVEPSQNLN